MALSANTEWQKRNAQVKTLRNRVIKTGAKIYQGAILAINTAGRVYPAANDTTGRFFGIAEAECFTGNGTRTCNAYDSVEILVTLKTGVTAGHRFTAMYAFDDSMATQLTTLGPVIGVLTEFVSATSGWVQLRAAALAAGS